MIIRVVEIVPVELRLVVVEIQVRRPVGVVAGVAHVTNSHLQPPEVEFYCFVAYILFLLNFIWRQFRHCAGTSAPRISK